MEWMLLALLGLQGYFTIFRLTPQSVVVEKSVGGLKTLISGSTDLMQTSSTIISTLNSRLQSLETEIKLRQMDSARIIEWLEKRDLRLTDFQKEMSQHLNIEVREKRLDHHQSEIIQLGKEIRLIREKK